MIKVGISHNLPDVENLVRRLVKHPDVEIMWMYNFDRTFPVYEKYPGLLGEFDMKYTDKPDLDAIDLLIGYPSCQGIKERSGMKSIFCTSHMNCCGVVDHPVEIGLPEFNRKALVRGALSAYLPDETTYMGALALMPLAKNLLLTGDISASVLLTNDEDSPQGMAAWGKHAGDFMTCDLCEKVLKPLQISFNSTLNILPFTVEGDVSMGTFIIDTKMNAPDIIKLYHDFYDDHRHVVILPENYPEARAAHVEGTNKSVIGIKTDGGRLFVSVAFDGRMKTGAGNIIHIMNLLFGLDERTGL